MIDNIIIRNFKKKDQKQIAMLHQETFQRTFDGLKEDYQSYVQENLEQVLEKGNLVIAEHEKKVVGFASYLRLGDNHDDREILEKWLLWINQPFTENEDHNFEKIQKQREILSYEFKKTLHERQQQIGCGEVIAQLYDNSLTQNKITITDNDFYFSDLAVAKKYHRQGIGTQLVQERIKIAREKDASLILVHCLIRGDGAKLYTQQSLGFLPIIEGSPIFDNGAGIRVYGKRL